VLGIPGSILDESRPYDVLPIDNTPKPAVVRVVPVVPHDEVRICGHGESGHIVPRALGSRDNVAIDVLFVGVGVRIAVHKYLLVDDTDFVTKSTLPLSTQKDAKGFPGYCSKREIT